nr:uncharacterized protein LOC128670289 isoform X2 [Plodia interpunctella]
MLNTVSVRSKILFVFVLHFNLHSYMFTVLKIGNITLHLEKGIVAIKNGTIRIENTNITYDFKLTEYNSTKLTVNKKDSESLDTEIGSIDVDHDYNKKPDYHYEMSIEKGRITSTQSKESMEEFTTTKTDDPCGHVCMDLATDDVEPVCMMYSRYKRGYHWFMNHCHARRTICLENLEALVV